MRGREGEPDEMVIAADVLVMMGDVSKDGKVVLGGVGAVSDVLNEGNASENDPITLGSLVVSPDGVPTSMMEEDARGEPGRVATEGAVMSLGAVVVEDEGVWSRGLGWASSKHSKASGAQEGAAVVIRHRLR